MIWLKKIFFSFWFWLFGWRVEGDKPDLKKYMIIVAPHTSNWDFLVGLAAKHIIDLHANFIGKASLFKTPVLGWFMRSIGGHPVDRARNNNLVDAVVELFDKTDEFAMALAPEGTRSYVPEIKTGFYHIARKAQVPILMVGLNYKRKVVEVNELFYPSGDMEKDMARILDYYRGVPGKIPQKGIR